MPASPRCTRLLQRLLAHRTAQHWGLETSTVNHGPEQGRILAIRTPSTRQPPVRARQPNKQPRGCCHRCAATQRTQPVASSRLVLASQASSSWAS